MQAALFMIGVAAVVPHSMSIQREVREIEVARRIVSLSHAIDKAPWVRRLASKYGRL